MNEWFILAGLIIALSLCALLISLCAFFRANGSLRRSQIALKEQGEEWAETVNTLQVKIESMSTEMQESASRRNVVEPLPGSPKACMNLTRRSQALRLRRKGDSPEQIAETLNMPRQEVSLLLKVHEIVLNNL
jgi:hypothetical protein